MRMTVLLLLLVTSLVGCQAQPKASRAASAPNAIVALTDQTLVYTCPQCGMDYDAPGKCKMCDADLVETRVAYICPADDKPVAHSGKCPRCDANARVTKTAVAVDAPPAGGAPSGAGTSTKAPDGAGSGATNGS